MVVSPTKVSSYKSLYFRSKNVTRSRCQKLAQIPNLFKIERDFFGHFQTLWKEETASEFCYLFTKKGTVIKMTKSNPILRRNSFWNKHVLPPHRKIAKNNGRNCKSFSLDTTGGGGSQEMQQYIFRKCVSLTWIKKGAWESGISAAKITLFGESFHCTIFQQPQRPQWPQ